MKSFRLIADNRELIDSCQRFMALRNSSVRAEREFFEGRIRNIKRFVALSQPEGGYIFVPGAYVAYHDASTLQEWKEITNKVYRQQGRNHLDRLLRRNLIDEGHPLYGKLKQAYEVFCGGIEPSSGDVEPLRFWLVGAEDNETAPSGGDDWSDQELSSAVAAYLQMLSLEQANKPYTKTSFNESLRQRELKKRTAGSVEYRMQNISAVLEELCLPRIAGYKPAKNLGDKIKTKIKKMLESQSYIPAGLYEFADDGAELDRRVAAIRKHFALGQPKGNPSPARSSTVREVFIRDPLVKACVLEEAGDICECCGEKAPFTLASGLPYLEVHHVRTLSEGGSDQVSNAVAICPNCHRGLHLSKDRGERKAILYQKIKRLIQE